MKFAFITPRYGADIAEGPEHACRLLAEQVCERHDVDVITTCARSARTWHNECPEGLDRVRGVLVRRFSVTQPHDAAAFRQLSDRLFTSAHSRSEELDWVRRLGPWSPGLIDFLKRQHRTYDALVFFSLMHATTVHGVEVAPERSLVFPYVCLHPALRLGLWRDLLSSSRGVGFLSATEGRLVRSYLRAPLAAEELVGIGIDPPPQQSYPRHQQDPADTVVDEEGVSAEAGTAEEREPGYLDRRGMPFRRRLRLYGTLALYGGRVDGDNGCAEMLEYFDTYASSDGDTSLVLLGVKMMKLPEAPYLRLAGVLPDRDRMIAYEAADVTIAPASEDLLAQSLLESFAVGTPALASARNAAAVEHCRRANAGLYYANRGEFVEAMRILTTNTRLRERLGENGRQYIRQNYRWDAVLGRFDRLVSKVKGR